MECDPIAADEAVLAMKRRAMALVSAKLRAAWKPGPEAETARYKAMWRTMLQAYKEKQSGCQKKHEQEG